MKKRYIQICTLLGVAALSFLAASCLKDDRFVDFGAVGQVVEFPDAIAKGSTALSVDTVAVRVDVTGPYAPTSNVEVSLGIVPAAIDAYNENTTHVPGTLLPPGAYTFPSTVTIVAGKDASNSPNRTVSFLLIIDHSKLPVTPGVNYVLPIGITGVPSGMIISGNYGAILFNFYHNPYDGSYHRVGTRWNFNATGDYKGWDNAANTPTASSTVASHPNYDFPAEDVLTVNATTSRIEIGNANGGFGTVDIVIDPATNFITDFITTDDTGLNAVAALPGTQSYYDPAAKKLYLWYQYQNVDASGNPTSFRVLQEVMTHN